MIKKIEILEPKRQKIIDITAIGWELPFESMDHIEYTKDEIYLVHKEIPKKTEEKAPEEIQKIAKVGDYV